MLYQPNANLFHKFRFKDHLITMNNKNFEKNIRNIYPAEKELKKEKQISKNANFLNWNINVQNYGFQAIFLIYKTISILI